MLNMAHGRVTDLQEFTDPDAALARITEIYDRSCDAIKQRFAAFAGGDRDSPAPHATYPYVGIAIGQDAVNTGSIRSFGNLAEAGTYGTTVTNPSLFASYYREQIRLLIENHGMPVVVGVSDRPIPLPFVVEGATTGITADDTTTMQKVFRLPDLSRIDDAIANGTYVPSGGAPLPLALFTAERVDYSLSRLRHYTGTSPQHFQRFILFTNYQRYVDEFIAYAEAQVARDSGYRAFVSPGNVVKPNPTLTDEAPSGTPPRHLPQMPSYHLVRDHHEGISLVNIGVGPANAKTITDHISVLRPHCWLMVGHCGGLRRTQRLGDYVLAHAYVREDNVLDNDIPSWAPIPAIAEIQVALTAAVSEISGLTGRELKTRLRTGTVFTTDDRNWELKYEELAKRFNQSRAIAVDMESATIAANGFRLRVPYGTLLCVSDKPVHGEIKLAGMANAFYQERVGQHLRIGIETLESLRDAGTDALHSRKLRSFDEPAFR